jgi:catechol 2,3-dioxygenase-like lactoylglutathione lyase family enzyme
MAIDVDMIGLTTGNMAESLRFYKTLGVETPAFNPDEDYLEAKLPCGVRLSWNTVELIKQIDPDWVQPVGQRLGIAFLCASPAEVDEVFGRVTSAGFNGKKEPWDAFWGQRYAILEDPDGNAVELFAPLK